MFSFYFNRKAWKQWLVDIKNKLHKETFTQRLQRDKVGGLSCLFDCKFDFCLVVVDDLNHLFSSYDSSCSRNQKCIAMALFYILIKPILLFVNIPFFLLQFHSQSYVYCCCCCCCCC